MSSADDYFQMLGERSTAAPRSEMDNAALLLKQAGNTKAWPEDNNSALIFEDILAEQAISMGKLEELRRMGALAFAQKYGLGQEARGYLKYKGEGLESLRAEELVNQLDGDLKNLIPRAKRD